MDRHDVSTPHSFSGHVNSTNLNERGVKKFNGNEKNRNYRPTKRIRIDLETVDATVQNAFNHLNSLSRRDMSAFWSHLSKLLKLRQRRKSSSTNEWNNQQKLSNHQLEAVLYHTMHMLDTCDEWGTEWQDMINR